MNHDLTSSPCSTNMNEFRKKKFHCDVTIIVDGREFPCHRLVLSSASDYFNGMFNGDFDESKAENITLKEELDADTFEEILNVMYTANISITSENAYYLWKACSFFGMRTFEKFCAEYIEQNLPVDHLVEVCLLADVLKEETLLTKLASYIAKNIIHLFKTNEFSRLPFHILKLILSQDNLEHNDVVFSIIVSWAKKTSNVSDKLITELLEVSKMNTIDISTIARLIRNPDAFTACETDEQNFKNSDTKLKIVRKSSCGTLQVYAKAFNEDRCSYDMILLQYNGLNKWDPIFNFNTSFENLKTVVVEGRQYFLAYDRNRNSRFDSHAIFWMVEDGKRTQLREPPIISEHYHLIAIRNVIYFYCSLDTTRAISISVNSNLWPEKKDIDNCVFAYNCDLDIWTSTSKIITLVKGASLVMHEDMLYVIDGVTVENDKSNNDTGVQQYDYRCSKWSSKPGHFNYNYCYGAACVYKDELFLCGTYWNDVWYRSTSKYDFAAEKWTTLPTMNIGRANHVFIPYNNMLYVIDSKRFPMEKYDPNLNTWDDELSLPKKVVLDGFTMHLCDTTDAIIQV